MAKVTLRNVKKIYSGGRRGDVVAVRDFSLEVKDREFIVFVGPSGCGKSTALRMIAGLEEVSSGDILIDEQRVNDVSPKDRDIAMVFQNYALYPHMTVFENLAFGLKMRNFPKAEVAKRVQEVATILGIGHYLNRRPRELSGGERQRVAVGRAIVRHPKVFLFDEPLSNLDAKLRLQMRAEIIKLHQRLQVTMIYVTHDQIEAMTMGDRIVVIKDGDVQQIDSPMALYHRPVNLFVAGFLGSPPMNFLHGKLKESGDHLVFREKGGAMEIKLGERPAARAFTGREVVLGIRPENLLVVQDVAKPARFRFQAVVDIVEPMGGETNVYLQTGGHTMVCRTDTLIDNSEVGHRLQFEFDVEKVHLFDPTTTLSII